MISSLRRGAAAAALTALPLAALAACGAGTDAETGLIRPDNAYTEVEDIKVQNVNVIVPDGEDGPAGISARLFNNGTRDQTLEAVRLPGTGQRVQLTPAEGESRIVVPAGGTVALGGEGNPGAVIVEPAPGSIRLGSAQRVVFDLSVTGRIPLRATVVPTSGDFAEHADWGPSATPEPEATEETVEQPEETEGSTDGGTEDVEGTDGAAGGTEGETGVEGTEGVEGTGGTEGEEGADGDATAPEDGETAQE